MHNGFIERGGEKMAKSVGNIDRLRDLLDEFPGEAVRLMLLKTHYRSPLEFTKDGLKEARADLDYFYGVLARNKGVKPNLSVAPTTVLAALEDDLNTAQAFGTLHVAATWLHKAETPDHAERAKGEVLAIGGLLGLLNVDPDAWFRWQPKSAAALDVGKIAQLIDSRLAARKAKDFKEADRIRDELASQGVVLEDGPKGTTWRRAG